MAEKPTITIHLSTTYGPRPLTEFNCRPHTPRTAQVLEDIYNILRQHPIYGRDINFQTTFLSFEIYAYGRLGVTAWVEDPREAWLCMSDGVTMMRGKHVVQVRDEGDWAHFVALLMSLGHEHYGVFVGPLPRPLVPRPLEPMAWVLDDKIIY
ncbi:hypothetical protein BGX38DRAFT_1206249 [Terfezia claveryi]|nr:hypothetical protein BGX38DRAFT_1206249 [Terfezia claveryi]